MTQTLYAHMNKIKIKKKGKHQAPQGADYGMKQILGQTTRTVCF
jgi:hypothetical protein